MYLDSCEDNPSVFAQARQEIQSERGSILELFLKGREFDRAALLAEKYVDFGALLTVCDETMNEDKLSVYIDKLGDSGFTEFACKWYCLCTHNSRICLMEPFFLGTCNEINVKNCCDYVVRK